VAVLTADRDAPSAGTACVQCRANGHFCPAREFNDALEPVCRACASGDECGAAMAIRRLHEPWIEDALESAIAPVRQIDPASVEIRMAPEIAKSASYSPDSRREVAQAERLHRAVLDRRKSQERASQRVRNHRFRENHPVQHPKEPAPMNDPATSETPTQPTLRKCVEPGCPHNASPRGSYCTSKHFYKLQKELGIVQPIDKKQPAAPKAALRVEQPASPAPSDSLQIVFELTEPQCDAIWQRCTPSQKAKALGTLLHALLAL
jgi:hypothetical protein